MNTLYRVVIFKVSLKDQPTGQSCEFWVQSKPIKENVGSGTVVGFEQVAQVILIERTFEKTSL